MKTTDQCTYSLKANNRSGSTKRQFFTRWHLSSLTEMNHQLDVK